MNWFVLAAAVLATMTTLGHFMVGTKEYLVPMLGSSMDPVPKKVMQAVFHYVSAFLILSAVALYALAFGTIPGEAGSYLAAFISANYALFAIWELVIAFGSGIKGAPLKMFHWIFFVLIAALAGWGSCPCCCGGCSS
jgi:hypothetical protein